MSPRLKRFQVEYLTSNREIHTHTGLVRVCPTTPESELYTTPEGVVEISRNGVVYLTRPAGDIEVLGLWRDTRRQETH